MTSTQQKIDKVISRGFGSVEQQLQQARGRVSASKDILEERKRELSKFEKEARKIKAPQRTVEFQFGISPYRRSIQESGGVERVTGRIKRSRGKALQQAKSLKGEIKQAEIQIREQEESLRKGEETIRAEKQRTRERIKSGLETGEFVEGSKEILRGGVTPTTVTITSEEPQVLAPIRADPFGKGGVVVTGFGAWDATKAEVERGIELEQIRRIVEEPTQFAKGLVESGRGGVLITSPGEIPSIEIPELKKGGVVERFKAEVERPKAGLLPSRISSQVTGADLIFGGLAVGGQETKKYLETEGLPTRIPLLSYGKRSAYEKQVGLFAGKTASYFIPTSKEDTAIATGVPFAIGGLPSAVVRPGSFVFGGVQTFQATRPGITPEERTALGLTAIGGFLGASPLARKLALKRELKLMESKLKPSEKALFQSQLKEARAYFGLKPTVKEISLGKVEYLPAKAQRPLFEFIEKRKGKLIVGGSVAERTQLYTKPIGQPHDIDLYLKGFAENWQSKFLTKKLAGELKSAGVKRVSIPPKQPTQITIGGKKAIEIHPYKEYFRPNVEQVIPFYRSARAGVVKTPSGIKVMDLPTQWQRMLVRGYFEKPEAIARAFKIRTSLINTARIRTVGKKAYLVPYIDHNTLGITYFKRRGLLLKPERIEVLDTLNPKMKSIVVSHELIHAMHPYWTERMVLGTEPRISIPAIKKGLKARYTIKEGGRIGGAEEYPSYKPYKPYKEITPSYSYKPYKSKPYRPTPYKPRVPLITTPPIGRTPYYPRKPPYRTTPTPYEHPPYRTTPYKPRVPTYPDTPIIPKIPGIRTSKKKKRKIWTSSSVVLKRSVRKLQRLKQPTKYQPSFTALVIKLKAKKKPILGGGLTVRPIINSY